MKIRLIVGLLFFVGSVFAYDVSLNWATNSSANSYKIYYGNSSRNYDHSINVGKTNYYTISNLTNNVTFFSATSIGNGGIESLFGNEAIYYYDANMPTNVPLVYLGMKVDYGTNLAHLSSYSKCVASLTANSQFFYGSFLVMTNRPCFGAKPNDTNSYLYLVEQIQYGNSLTNLINVRYDLMSFTNAPNNEFYRGSLILTNGFF